jgi:hypothetical protein
MDFVSLGVVATFFVLTWLLVKMCEELQQDRSEGR